MAATLAQQSSFGLQAPATDDTMEISSDFGAMDGDIDIDLDSAGEHMHYNEDDDQMIDDVNQERPHYHDDDVMVDGDGDAASNPGDREMQDDASAPPQEHDEELLDFSEDEDVYTGHDAVVDPSVAPTIVEPPLHDAALVVDEPVLDAQTEAAVDPISEGAAVLDQGAQQHQEDSQPQSTPLPADQDPLATPPQHDKIVDAGQDEYTGMATLASEQGIDSERAEDSTGVEQDEVAGHAAVPAISLDHSGDEPSQVQQSATPVEVTDGETTLTNSGDHKSPRPVALAVDTEVARDGETEDAVSTRASRPSSPTVTGMHPTIVDYRENEIFLFPSRAPSASEQYLLGNENLVTTSLGDLLQACRSVLGESLSEDEELVLGVDELDLYISEVCAFSTPSFPRLHTLTLPQDSTPAFSTTFAELLDAYLKLHKHDGNGHPPPFRVSLTTKTRFTNRLNLITQAIAEGKGFSQLTFLQESEQAYEDETTFFEDPTGFPDEEDFDDEDFQDDYREYTYTEAQDDQQTATENIRPSTGQSEEHPSIRNQDNQQAEEQAQPRQEDLATDRSDANADDNQVSYETEPDHRRDELAEPFHPTAPLAHVNESQDGPQHHETLSEEVYEEVHGQNLLDDHSEPVAPDPAIDPYGDDDDTINFDEDDHDDDSSLTTTASAEGISTRARPDTSLAEGSAFNESDYQLPQDDVVEHHVPAVEELPPSEEEVQTGETEDNGEAPGKANDPDTTTVGQYEVIGDSDAHADIIDSAEVDVSGETAALIAHDAISKAGLVEHPEHEDEVEDEQDIDLGEGLEGDGDVAAQDDSFQVYGNDAAEQDKGLDFDADHVGGYDETSELHTGQHEEVADESTVNGNGVTPEHDPDVIDFDDDDQDFDDEPSPSQEVDHSDSDRASPSIKRSYSERNEAEETGANGQALKKIRSS